MTAKRLLIGKVPIDVITFAGALAEIERLVEARRGGFVFTPNVDHIVTVEAHAEFAAAYQRADLSLADGTLVVWASRLLPTPLPEKVSGSDLVGPLLERAAHRRWRVALCGAGPGVAERAAGIARARWGTDVVFTDAPMLSLEDGAQVDGLAARLAAARADLALMAFGAPKQELLISRIADRVRPAVLLGVGASLDFLAGTVRRAPPLISRVGLEWAFRLAQEPRRLWRRYLVNDPKFVPILLRAVRAARR